jgi:mannan endo-1,4-beta-mannosidase
VRARIVRAAVLAAACGTAAVPVSAVPVSAVPVGAVPVGAVLVSAVPANVSPARLTARPARLTASATLTARPDSILGVYNSGVPRSYRLVTKFGSEVGRRPNVVMYFSAWGSKFQTSFAQTARRHGAVPFVQLQPWGVSMRSIAAGRQDAYLRSYASAVRSFGHRVLIAFAHEMNGFWYPWGWQHTRPQVFRRAWRRVVTVFRRAGATNVSWIWVVNGLNPTLRSPLRAWWPGAKYVTWAAMDCYYVRRTQTFESLFGPTIAAIRRVTRKPELIAEVGIGPAAGQALKAPGLFAGIQARHLLGLVYYDKRQHSGTYHQNWRIDDHPPAVAAFRRSIRRYLR